MAPAGGPGAGAVLLALLLAVPATAAAAAAASAAAQQASSSSTSRQDGGGLAGHHSYAWHTAALHDQQQCAPRLWYSMQSSCPMHAAPGSTAAAREDAGAALQQPANTTTSTDTLGRSAGGSSSMPASTTINSDQEASTTTSSFLSQPGGSRTAHAAAQGQVYIARFSEYRMLTELKGLVTQALSGVQQHWSWVARDNTAVRLHPTDFALLSVGDASQLTRVQQLLQAGVPGFRDLHRDRRIKGSSNWQPEGPLAAAFTDAHLQQQPDQQPQQQQQQQGHPALRQTASSLKLVREELVSQQPAEEEPLSHQQQQQAAGLGLAAAMMTMMPTKQLLADAPPPSTTHGPGSSTQQQQQQQQQQQPGEQQAVQPPPDAAAAGAEEGAAAGGDDDDDSIWAVHKPPGRMSTAHTIGLDPKSKADRDAGYNKDELRRRQHRRRRRGLLGWAAGLLKGTAGSGGGQEQQPQRGVARRKLQDSDTRVTSLLEAPKLWKQGYSGKGIKVGVFDTGIREGHPHIRNIKERTNWTHQNSLSDGLGHGSFVAGVIGSQDTTCPGFAPDMELYTFKVFTDDQVSYTSWFLDAFNHAIARQLTIINLSIGGPDFLDQPFVDKVLEVTSNGLIMISAIGNDGPLYGTLNNPADQPDVIGVGGIDNDNNIAGFSSRGMTTWELPVGTGRIKPDVMAYGKDVTGSKITTGCRSLSGTSVASPVVAGAASLLASTLPDERRWLLNPGSLKQALVEGAVRLPQLNMYEQGNGRINLPASQQVLAAYEPRASIIPPAIDFTDCPYMWPYCTQPLYAFGLPVAFNATIVNGMAVTGQMVDPPVFKATDEGGKLLHVSFQYSSIIWPWSGYLALFIEVSPGAWNYSGVASGNVTFHVMSPPQYGSKSTQVSIVTMPIKVNIMPTPPREKRIVWDVLHSIKYPPGYVPRDNLDIKTDVLDWHGDHPFTNFHDTLNVLREAGYFVEILHSPSSCFHPENYGAYLVMDSEEEWYPEEVEALSAAVKEHGMALVVFAEWYHLQSLKQMKFFDDNTRSWWTPITGGANVPALNDLLAPHNITLGERILQGVVQLGQHKVTVSFGANIAKFPAGGYLHVTNINDASGKNNPTAGDWAAFGLTASGKGQVAVLGDTNCLDSSHMVTPCFDFLKDLLATLLTANKDSSSSSSSGLMAPDKQLKEPYTAPGFTTPPQRRSDVNFTTYSWVLQHKLTCLPTSPCQYRPASSSSSGTGGGSSTGACPSGDKAWEHKRLVVGQEPPQTLLLAAQEQQEQQRKAAAQEAAARESAAAAAAEEEARKAAAAAAAPAAGGSAAGSGSSAAATEPTRSVHTQQQQQHQVSSLSASSSGGGSGDSNMQAEVAQQRQRSAFVSQAASWGTLICIVGLMGLVVLWQMRVAARRNMRGYLPTRRSPSPPPVR